MSANDNGPPEDNVVRLGTWIRPEVVRRQHEPLVPVDNVLAGALAAGVESVVVAGRMPDGSLYLAGSHDDAILRLLLGHASHVIDRNVHLSGCDCCDEDDD